MLFKSKSRSSSRTVGQSSCTTFSATAILVMQSILGQHCSIGYCVACNKLLLITFVSGWLYWSNIRTLPRQYQCMIFHLLQTHQGRIHTQTTRFQHCDSPLKESRDLPYMDLINMNELAKCTNINKVFTKLLNLKHNCTCTLTGMKCIRENHAKQLAFPFLNTHR